MMKKLIIGIDPGYSGGIAVIDNEGSVVKLLRMPATVMDLYDCLSGISTIPCDGIFCYMEKVGMGMPGQSSKATATFARHCGHIEMALAALGIPTVEVTPQRWMKYFAIGSSKDYNTKAEWKNKLKQLAQQRFPLLWKSGKITLATADALLIALYGKEKKR